MNHLDISILASASGILGYHAHLSSKMNGDEYEVIMGAIIAIREAIGVLTTKGLDSSGFRSAYLTEKDIVELKKATG